jgi:hypothetical protein
MLIRCTWHIRAGPLDRKVVVHMAFVDGSRRLRDQLHPPHATVPFRGAVNGNLDTLLGGSICRVLVACGEVDIFCHRTATVDVLLVGTDLVGP